MEKMSQVLLLSLLFLTVSCEKCQNVECGQGQYCFYGRCKAIDYECLDVSCPQNHYCKEGKCIEQKHKPSKEICKPLGFQQMKTKCDSKVQELCQKEAQKGPTCGYNWRGHMADYDGLCSACADEKVTFVYRASCKWAPRVCKEEEDCMNGVCEVIFDDEAFENSQTCNHNRDCEVTGQECAGHKCLDRRIIFSVLASKAETQGIGIRF